MLLVSKFDHGLAPPKHSPLSKCETSTYNGPGGFYFRPRDFGYEFTRDHIDVGWWCMVCCDRIQG